MGVALLISGCSMPVQSGSVNAEGEWEPDRSIEFIAPAAAGGGWDTTARMLAKTIDEEKIADHSFGVVNKPGGGGAVAWAYIHKRNDPIISLSPRHRCILSPWQGSLHTATKTLRRLPI